MMLKTGSVGMLGNFNVERWTLNAERMTPWTRPPTLTATAIQPTYSTSAIYSLPAQQSFPFIYGYRDTPAIHLFSIAALSNPNSSARSPARRGKNDVHHCRSWNYVNSQKTLLSKTLSRKWKCQNLGDLINGNKLVLSNISSSFSPFKFQSL